MPRKPSVPFCGTLRNFTTVLIVYPFMSTSKKTDIFDILLTFAMGVFAVFALKSLFDNDASKIVSERGAQILSDPEALKEVEQRREDEMRKHTPATAKA